MDTSLAPNYTQTATKMARPIAQGSIPAIIIVITSGSLRGI